MNDIQSTSNHKREVALIILDLQYRLQMYAPLMNGHTQIFAEVLKEVLSGNTESKNITLVPEG